MSKTHLVSNHPLIAL
jgi:PTH1 family peptidyl-tRNA hydrolase